MFRCCVIIILLISSVSCCFFDSDCPSGQVCQFDWTEHTHKCIPFTSSSHMYALIPIIGFVAVVLIIFVCWLRHSGHDIQSFCRNCCRCCMESETSVTVNNPQNETQPVHRRPVYLPMLSTSSASAPPPPYSEAVKYSESQANSPEVGPAWRGAHAWLSQMVMVRTEELRCCIHALTALSLKQSGSYRVQSTRDRTFWIT